MFFIVNNTNHIINDIISTAKIFAGDVFGGAVRDFRIGGNSDIKDVDIRLDSYYYKPFLTLMSTKYKIEQHLPCKKYNGITINTFEVSPKHIGLVFKPIFVDIVIMTHKIFRVSFIDFDVNLLTENDSSLFLRVVPYAMKYLPDKLQFIKDRISKKNFSCLDTFKGERALDDLIIIIEKSIKMTLKNWEMDDCLQNKSTWVVGKWGQFVQRKHKKKYSHEQHKQLVANEECSLCYEKFKSDDIILNTACNHNFHWKCNHTNGLAFWVKDREKNTCPCCRSDMFFG